MNATSWMVIIYAIKEEWTIGNLPAHLFGIMLLTIPVLLSWLSLLLTRFLGEESPESYYKEMTLADKEFLPIYLGYFFCFCWNIKMVYNDSCVSDSIHIYVLIADAIF